MNNSSKWSLVNAHSSKWSLVNAHSSKWLTNDHSSRWSLVNAHSSKWLTNHHSSRWSLVNAHSSKWSLVNAHSSKWSLTNDPWYWKKMFNHGLYFPSFLKTFTKKEWVHIECCHIHNCGCPNFFLKCLYISIIQYYMY